MTDLNQLIVQVEASTDSKEKEKEQEEPASQLRRTTRIRTFTEKGKEMQDEKIKWIQQRFENIFEKWRTRAKSSKQPLPQSELLSEDLLNYIMSDVSGLSADVQRAYNELRQLTPPDQETRRKVDICVQIS